MDVFSRNINSTTEFRINFGLNLSTNASNNDSQIYDNSFYFASPVRFVLGVINLVFAIFGCLGNSLIIIVSIKSKFSLKTTMIYFTALAISDITVLVTNAFGRAVADQLNSGLDVALTNPIICKVTNWIGYSCVQASSWILVAVTIERLICITFPFKVKKYCYPKVSKIIVSSIFIVIYGTNSHFLYGMQVQKGRLCYPLPGTYAYFVTLIYPWVELCVAFAVPCIAIVIGNSIIIYKLYQRSKNLGKMADSNQDIRTKQISMTVMLVVVNIMFIIFMAPWSLFNAVYEYNEHRWIDPTFVLWDDILNAFTNLNSVSNFYLYYLSGKSFRNQVKAFLNRLRCGGNVENAPGL